MDVHFYRDGVLIACTLTEVPHPVAAAVIINGSGPAWDTNARLRPMG